MPSSTNHRSMSVNSTWEPDAITFFIIQGLVNFGEKRIILFVILLLGYIIILGGNSMIIFVALTDLKLNSPMYFFLYNLSIVDIIYTTITIPKMLTGFLTDKNTISVPGCFLQMHFFIQVSVTSYAILTVMAYDRYVAICNPLRYAAVMTRPVQLLLIVGAWSFSAFCTLPATSMTWLRPYCGSNVVRNGWCDLSSVRRLVCADTSVDNIVSVSFAILALLTTGVLILTSYVLIGVSMLKMGVAQRRKAFGTCAAHLTVVSVSYSSASCVYISYRVENFSPEFVALEDYDIEHTDLAHHRDIRWLSLGIMLKRVWNLNTRIQEFCDMKGKQIPQPIHRSHDEQLNPSTSSNSVRCRRPWDVVESFGNKVRIVVSVLFSALTPFLHPMIYSLRNKELRESISRTLSRFRPAVVLPKKDVNTVS